MKDTADVLVVEDEANIRSALMTMVERRGHKVRGARTGEEALTLLDGESATLLITDLKLPGMGGVELLRRVKDRWPETEAILLTAYGSIETAVEAMRLGAYDYLTKPIDRDRFLLLIEKALERHGLAMENKHLRDRLETRTRFDQMIGESEPMQRLYTLVEMVAGSDVAVLLTGESGAGKELVARAIHHKSARQAGPFITINCGALPDSLLESELFGYERGAFTGATHSKVGRFELADGGTLLLDEVGELAVKSQVDFLRVLETKEFRRLGGTKVIRVDVRIIAATNRDLEEAVREGSFRDDLYYRLNVVPIRLPSLRDRAEDIPLLVDSFLREFAARHQRDLKRMSQGALRLLRAYHWPGNVRQLRNVIERLVVTVAEQTIQPDHLPEEIQAATTCARSMVIRLGTPLEKVEREIIRRTLREVTSHREQAAQLLGISVRALQYKIKEYEIHD